MKRDPLDHRSGPPPLSRSPRSSRQGSRPGRTRLRTALRAVSWCAAILGIGSVAGCGTSIIIAATLTATLGDSGSSSRVTTSVVTPSVTAITPAAESHRGGVTVTVTGADFPADATVTIGGVSAGGVVVQGPTQLTATLPASASLGPVDVTVTNPNGGTGSLVGGFTYTNGAPAAVVTDLPSPLSQNVVFSVTLTDAESDPIDLQLEIDSGGGFQPLPASLILSGSLEGLTSSPVGIVHNLTWDSGGSFPAQNASGVRLRITPVDTIDGLPGTAGVSNAFDIGNNTPVSVELLQPGTDAFDVVLSYRVADPDAGDSVGVTGMTWVDLNSGASGNLTVDSGQGIGSVPFSSGGALSSTVWSSLSDLGLGNNKLVQVTITVSDGTTSASASSQPFFVSNGPVSDPAVFGWGRRPAGFALGDLTGDGRPDAVACDQFSITGPARVVLLRNGGQSFQAAQELLPPALPGVPFDPLPADPGPAIPGPRANAFLSALPSLSECALLDADGDGDLDLIAAESLHNSIETESLLQNTARVLTDAGTDEFIIAPGSFPDVVAHQVTLRALQGPSGLDVAGGVYESAQAAFNDIAGHVPLTGPTTFPPGAPSGDQGLDLFGWFVQDLEAADLDGPGAPGTGDTDLVILHGVRQLRSALGGDVRGCVVIRQLDAGGNLGTPFYLDPTDMGALPTQCAVGDLTDDAHASPTNPLAPLQIPDGTPDIVVANAGDNSLTFYLQVAPSPTPGVLPPTYTSINLPLTAINPAFNPALIPGDTFGLAIGDLNGDGKSDLVVVGQLSQTCLVFVHDPDPAAPGSLVTATGGILPLRVSEVIALPELQVGRPALADVTNDGRDDLLIPMPLLNSLLIYQNRGTVAASPSGAPTPVFGPGPMYTPVSVSFPTRFQPYQAQTADLNGDGRTDVAVGCLLSQELSVFYQQTQGTLDELVAVPTGGLGPFLMDSGDVNGDGRPDVVVSMPDENSVFVFSPTPGALLTRSATFDLTTPPSGPVPVPPPTVVVARLPFAASVGDATGDGLDDILVAMEVVAQINPPGPTVGGYELIPGNPLAATVAAIQTGTFAAIGFDARAGDLLYPGGVPDGIPDIVLTQNQGGGVDLFQGLGGASFAPSSPRSVDPRRPTNAQIVDLDGDGHLDLVVGDGSAAQQDFMVFYNGGAPPADPVNPIVGSPPGFIGYGALPAVPVVVDVSPAGVPGTEAITVAILADQLGGPGPRTPIMGQVNTAGLSTELVDSTRDFVAGGVAVGMTVRKTSGAGAPATARVLAVTPSTLTITDLGAAALAPGDAYVIELAGVVTTTGALTQLIDASADFVSAGVLVGMYVRKTSGAGAANNPPVRGRVVAVTATTLTLTSMGAFQFLVGDGYAIDALPDLVFAGITNGSMGMAFQTAPRTFGVIPVPTGMGPGQVSTGDLNGDGLVDFVVPWSLEDRLAVYLQNPTPAPGDLSDVFLGPITLPASNAPIGSAVVDVDGDGRNDVVVSSRAANSLNVYLQR
jgi:IPT/TIG domain/FG-GAP-like repeat